MIDETERENEEFTGPEPKSSAGILSALRKAEDAFRDWQIQCSDIDAIYNLGDAGDGVRHAFGEYEFRDTQLDLFWSSFEVLKPAVYARPPQPVVSPLFKDNRRLPNVTAEVLERTSVSVLKRTCIDAAMKQVRDDLIFTSRGQLWLTYEDGKDGKCVDIEHADRKDFLHEPARKWQEVGWAAKRSWLTRAGARKRFKKTSGDAYKGAKYQAAKDRDGDRAEEDRATAKKAGFWEVWHKADNKCYWVAEGVDVLLDEGEPHLKLSDFFPCPEPAYATTRRRSLIPIPDYRRYAIHFRKISDLTGRIYLLLDKVRMKGLIPAGGDIGDAVEELLRSDDDEILIPVPGAAMLAQGATGFVAWLPLQELAEAIQGLISARSQLIDDFYQLSGISDIMRGATEEQETLGAQRMKAQFGSVRVREKSAEMQRIAADAVKIAAEIIAEKFDQKTLLDMCQMEIPTKADLKKRVDEIEKAAKEELKAVAEKAKQAAQQQQQPVDPAQGEQMFQQAQQQVLQKYAPMLSEAEQQVPIEDVMKLLRDDRARNFTFEIASDSTILTDEIEEKRSRNEFMEVFNAGMGALQAVLQFGPEAVKLWGAALKFQLAPYRVGREMEAEIDEFIDAAPKMAERMAASKGEQGESEGFVAAQKTLAEAEQMKAQAAMAAVQSKAELAQADNQRKMMELEQKGAIEADKHKRESEKLQQQYVDMAEKHGQTARKLEAEIDNLRAKTVEILNNIGLANKAAALDEFQSVADVELRQGDQSLAAQDRTMQAEHHETETQFRERGESRADRQQEFAEQSADERDA